DDVHDALIDDRDGLVGASRHSARPRELKPGDGVAVDLSERTETLLVVGAIEHEPIVGGRIRQHLARDRLEIGGLRAPGGREHAHERGGGQRSPDHDCLPLISFVLAPPGRAGPRWMKSSPKGDTPGEQTPAGARSRRRNVRPATNTRTLRMHKTFRISVVAYALAGFGAIASAQDQVEAGMQLYEEHCMGCHGEKLKAPG